MPILIKSGKVKAKDNITYSTEFGVYKLYTIGNIPLVFPLSPLKIEENQTYLGVFEVDFEKGEMKPVSLVRYEKKQSVNILTGVVRVKKIGEEYFAGKVKVEFENPPTWSYLNGERVCVGKAKLSGGKIKFKPTNQTKGEVMLIL